MSLEMQPRQANWFDAHITAGRIAAPQRGHQRVSYDQRMEWPTHHPPLAYWELSWFDRQSESIVDACRVSEIDPGELARALSAAVTRFEGVEPLTAEHVIGGEKPVDQPLADILQPYVADAIELGTFDYFFRLVDESGGRERTGWGDLVEEP
jgi:hypothetical protein